MEPVLKINLAVFGTRLLFQVEEQNDKYIRRGKGYIYTANNGYTIYSNNVAEIDPHEKAIYLQGGGDKSIVDILDCHSVEDAQRIKQEVLDAIGEFIAGLAPLKDPDQNPCAYEFYKH